MMRIEMFWVLLAVLCIFVSSSSLPNINIVTPKQGDRYFVQHGRTTSFDVVYHASEFDMQLQSLVCLELVHESINSKAGDGCFPVDQSSVVLNDVGSGDYKLILYLRDESTEGKPVVAGTEQVLKFSVVERSTPSVTLVATGSQESTTLVAVADAVTDVASLEVLLQLEQPLQAPHSLDVCLMLVDNQGAVLLPETCREVDEPSIVFRQLPVGDLTLHTHLRWKDLSHVEINRFNVRQYTIKVLRLLETYPKVQFLSPAPDTDADGRYVLEFVATDDDAAVGGQIAAKIASHHASAVAQVVLCLEIEPLPTATNAEGNRLFCQKPGQQGALALPPLPTGVHTATLTVRPISYADALTLDHVPKEVADAIRQSAVPVLIDVRKQVELVPSYNWQALHAWHSIPAGLEIRLPIGRGGADGVSPRKEARIPEPWRLQLPLPRPPCRPYFLRMDVRRDTTVQAVREAAAALCKVSADCFVVHGDGRPLPPQGTMESVGYFSAKQELSYAQHCSDTEAT